MRLALVLIFTGSLAAPAGAADFRTLAGHGGPVMSAEIGPDGEYALTGSFDNSVGYWDLTSEGVVWLEGHRAAVKTVMFLDKTTAASGGDDFAVRIWDLSSGQLKRTLSGHQGQVAGLALSPDGRRLASASWDGSVGIWDLDGDAHLSLTGHGGVVNDVAFAPDGRLFSASADGTIRVWDIEERAEVRRLVNHGFGVNKLVLHEGWLAYGAVDGGTRVIEADTGEEIADLTAGRRPILSLALSPDGSELSVGDGEGYVMSVATDGWRISGDFKAAGKGPVWALSYSADGISLLGGGIDDFAVIWPVAADLDAPVMGNTPRGFLADPDSLTNGERQYRRKCSICHSLEDDGVRRAGPTLSGIMGRDAGAVEGYVYSDTVANLGFAWSADTIDQLFDIGPDDYIPGSKMPQQRITRPEDRQDLIDFLRNNT